jgi:hypothetical protein
VKGATRCPSPSSTGDERPLEEGRHAHLVLTDVGRRVSSTADGSGVEPPGRERRGAERRHARAPGERGEDMWYGAIVTCPHVHGM